MRQIEIKKRANGSGCAAYLGKGRSKPWGAKITIGKDINGKNIYHFIDTFETELETLVCLENYHKNPTPLYIKEDKYNRIKTFPKIPYPLVSVENPEKSILEKVQKENYTFKQLFEKFKEAKMLTKEEAQLEKKYHIRPSNKPFGRNYCRGMTTAFHNSKELYDKVYKELRASDFNKFIKESQKGTSAQRQMVNLYMNLDKFALEEDSIDKGYAQYITAVTNDKKQVNKPQGREPEKEKVFTYEQIDYLWNFEAKSDGLQKQRKQDREIFIRDFWLMLLYCGCRADELLSVYTANVFLDKNYFVGGLKTEAGINRTIPIHPAIKHLFEKYYNPQNEFLFTQPNGNRIDYDYYLYHYQHNFYNLHPFISDHTSHDCRHTLRTELENLNIKQVIINSIIGHSNDNVGQDIYTHIPLIEKQEAINMVTYKKRKNLYIIAANQ